MSKRLESYLSDAASYLGALPREVREGELQEISGHLEQLVADYQLSGEDEATALAHATSRFGSARSVGLRLRDVWEGNSGLWVVALAVLVSNWCWLIAFGFAFMGFWFMLGGIVGAALSPLLGALLYALAFLLPLGWNFILGQWGGRRVVIMAPLAYAPLLLLPPAPDIPLVWNTEVHLPYAGLVIALALLGAWGGSQRRRSQRMAIVRGTSLAEATQLLARPRRWRERAIIIAYWALGLGLLSVGVETWVRLRVEAFLHPATPEVAVRVLLATPGGNYEAMWPSTDVMVRVLAPITPAERMGRERRVTYVATMHTTPEYRATHVAWMNRELKAARAGRRHTFSVAQAQAALEHLKPTGYRKSGILRVVKTPHGWQVDGNGDIRNDPWSWPDMTFGYDDRPRDQP